MKCQSATSCYLSNYAECSNYEIVPFQEMLLLTSSLDVLYKYMNTKTNTKCFPFQFNNLGVHEDDWFISLDTVYHDKTVFNSVGT